MSKKIKDTEYLYLSTKIRAMESRLLDRERMDRMLEAATVEDAAKVLVECGYPELSVVNVDTVDEILAQAREEVFAELSGLAPNEAMLDVFKVKYDYHNAKALLKSEALRWTPAAAGGYRPGVPRRCWRKRCRSRSSGTFPRPWPPPLSRPGRSWALPAILSALT